MISTTNAVIVTIRLLGKTKSRPVMGGSAWISRLVQYQIPDPRS